MRKNLFYQTVYRRRNVIKELVYDLFLALSSWPRFILEVFLRRNMGERYYSFFTAFIISYLMAVLPYAIAQGKRYNGDLSILDYIADHKLWYLFVAAFICMCILRALELKRLPSVFDFSRFSLSTGIVNPLFYKIKVFNKFPNTRTIETILEPAFCLIVGFILSYIDSLLGIIIMNCSFFYSMSYFAAYHQGDNFIMDKIDEIICNEELFAAFVEGKDSSATRGFNMYGRRPADPNFRRRVVESFFEDAEEAVVV